MGRRRQGRTSCLWRHCKLSLRLPIHCVYGARASGVAVGRKATCRFCCSLGEGGELMILRIGASKLSSGESFAVLDGVVEWGIG